MDFDRSTKHPSPLAVANIVCRGGTEDWRKLYRYLKENPSFRPTALKALAVADNEGFPGCVILFQDAIRRMDEDDMAASRSPDTPPGQSCQDGGT